MILSIIIPVYNVEKYIKKCLLSCINQKNVSKEEYEIIIVNDGTKDNSMQIIKETIDSLSPDLNNIAVISQKNMGLSEARNTGLRHANGDYVWFVDSDDWIDQDSVESIINSLKEGEVDILQMPFKFVYEGTDRIIIENVREIKTPLSGREIMKITRFPNLSQSRVIKTSFLKQNDLIFTPGILHEDAEFKPRLIWKAKKIKTLNKPCYNYLKRENGSITASFTMRNAVGRWFGVKSMYEFSKNFKFEDELLFNADMNFNMYWILTYLKTLKKSERNQIIEEISQNRKIFKRLVYTKSPKKFIVYSALYLCPKVFLKLLGNI